MLLEIQNLWDRFIYHPVFCRDKDHHKIVPMLVKATKMAINSSNPNFLDGEELLSLGLVLVMLMI